MQLDDQQKLAKPQNPSDLPPTNIRPLKNYHIAIQYITIFNIAISQDDNIAQY